MATKSSTNTSKAAADHGWFGTETVKTRGGNFEFKNSYPSRGTAAQLRETLVFNRAVEAYLVQMHGVSWYRVWKGIQDAGAKTPNQVVLWENLMDGATLLLTGNTETVYGLCADRLEARRAGRDRSAGQSARRTVRPVAARDHGDRSDRRRQGQGRQVPDPSAGSRRRSARRLPGCQSANLQCGLWRARLSGRKAGRRQRSRCSRPPKSIPCLRRPLPPATVFVNGSGQEIDTIFSDSGQYFADLAWMIEREPARQDCITRALPARCHRHRKGQTVRA